MHFIRALSFCLASSVVKSIPLTSDYDTFLNDGSTEGQFLISSSTLSDETPIPDTFGQTLDLTNLDVLSPSPGVPDLNTLSDFTEPDSNSATSDLLSDAIAFNSIVTPETDTLGLTIPEYSDDNLSLGDDPFGQGTEFASSPLSGHPLDYNTYESLKPYFPAICSTFRESSVVGGTKIIDFYRPTYGGGGMQNGRILGYSTAWKDYQAKGCRNRSTWFCCLEPETGEGCINLLESYPDIIGPDDCFDGDKFIGL